MSTLRRWMAMLGGLLFVAGGFAAQLPPAGSDGFGPYNARFLFGGEGIGESLHSQDPILHGNASWSMHGWFRGLAAQRGRTLLAGFGNPEASGRRYLETRDGKLALWVGENELVAAAVPAATGWIFCAATFDGKTARLYVDGKQVATAEAKLVDAGASLWIAPVPADSDPASTTHFGGDIADFRILPRALQANEVRALFERRPDFALVHFVDVSVGWPWQQKQLAGLSEPQAPWTLPVSRAPFSKPMAKAVRATPALTALSETSWTIGAWRLIEAPRLQSDAAAISSVGFDAAAWYVATVPGTVLTTLIDRGVFPDPDRGLDNLAIPESLSRQDYWYRTELTVPAQAAGRRSLLTFKGINYSAQVWLNGEHLGDIKGAFLRGVFDVTDRLRPGQPNALAVRISPPPHPGIPHEQSIKAGPGENGGALAIDGPTFIATEGWDWIPGIRDRNTGLWQDVVLSTSGAVRIGDAQVITRLPLPDTSRADVDINVPLENASDAAVTGTLTASFDDVTVAKDVTLAPGSSEVRLSPAQFAQLSVRNPRLWWPNGYGTQELHTLHLKFAAGSQPSDARDFRFGMRHVTYELSLFDTSGALRRVEADLALGSSRGERLIDVRHEALKKSPKGWAASLYPDAMQSPAIHVLQDESLTPYLVLKVNGVRIASRGGNWGMDDSRKRVSREKLEPYFRLHREANLNTIRNWVGQNTEDEFYDLADEYGMLVLNDFWASTQDFQVEPEDAALFLDNARDVISRYRNHPSIAVWFGRNEGVPQPILNSGLADLVAQLDGTRHYTGSSNRVNLQGSGPYNYRAPSEYFTGLAAGYSVEVGTPSLSTLESIRAWIAPADQWPIGDALAYHDWHHGGNGDVASFMKALQEQFGAATSLEDFERKAQMMNYVTHRAMFEGFNAHLWTRNSGRLLWMTHPAWPSNAWQIYSSDYDTHAAYYGVKKAAEPIHVQMNLPDFTLAVINNRTTPLQGLQLHSRVFALDNTVLAERQEDLSAAANAVTNLPALALQSYLESHGVVLVKLELFDARHQLLSENFYWQARDEAANRSLNALPRSQVAISADAVAGQGETRLRVKLHNAGKVAALANKLTLVDAAGQRVLPVYYSDNYVSLLPGETRELTLALPTYASARSDSTAIILRLRGWNASAPDVRVVLTR